MPSHVHPQSRVRHSGAVDVPKEVCVWDVGIRIGAAIHRYTNTEAAALAHGEPTQHALPRPHIRRAHWHHYWVGSKVDGQELSLKWLPPIPVGVDWESELPTVVRRVLE